MSRERPILFNGAMVRAILSGQKTQTRRVLKQATGPSLSVDMSEDSPGVAELSWLRGAGPGHDVEEDIARVPCPFGQPGDRLWVRETWGVGSRPDPWGGYDGIEYRADVHDLELDDYLPCHKVETPDDICLGDYRAGWKPSIHMPRWACRLVLEVTDVRVERLHEISLPDLVAEGIACYPDVNPLHDFEELWTSTGGDWSGNPWVWVVSFKVVTP